MWSLAGVAQWIGAQPVGQKDASLILAQVTFLDFRPGPLLGVCERQLIDVSLCIDVSLPLFLPPSLSKNK